MLIYNSHERALNYAHAALITFTQVHLHNYLKLGVFAESVVAHSSKPTIRKRVRVHLFLFTVFTVSTFLELGL